MKRITAAESVSGLSRRTRAAIVSLAEEHGAREAWMFGSAAGVRSDPNDIDIAILGLPKHTIEALKATLQERFVGCRVDEALGYKRPELRTPRQLHFVLADDSRGFWAHPISRSIEQGVCFSRLV